VIIAGKKLGQSQLALMQLLGMVLEDAETTDLEGVFKREPGLAMNLMRLTNSVASGVRTKVTSMRHAISVLGRRQLQRWLQLLLYTNPSGGTGASPLLQLAATRGRMMELVAGKLHAGQKELEDRAFMTGIMSLMPSLMGTPLEEILKGINLSNDIRAALEEGAGELGTMIKLCEALETGDGFVCAELCQSLPGLQAATVNACQTQALAWASNIGRENPDN
jgi:c-di-GMP-related signal transduction protein